MSKTILITLNNSGNDPGPYDLTLIDGSGNETPWSSNPVTKAQLIAGYQMTVPDLIVKVKVKSKTCTTFIQLTIPTTQCPCRIVSFSGNRGGDSIFNFYQCGQTTSTDLTVGDTIISYCVDMNKPIIQSSIVGSYNDTGICCPPNVNPVPTPTTTTSTTSTTSTTTTSSTTTTTTSSITTTSTTTTTTVITPVLCRCYEANDLLGCEFEYTQCDGTVVPFTGTPGDIICAQVGSITQTVPCFAPGGYVFFTPLGTNCNTDEDCI